MTNRELAVRKQSDLATDLEYLVAVCVRLVIVANAPRDDCSQAHSLPLGALARSRARCSQARQQLDTICELRIWEAHKLVNRLK